MKRNFNVGMTDTGSGNANSKAEKEWEKRLGDAGVSPSSRSKDSTTEWDRVKAQNGLITDPDELIRLGFDTPGNFTPQAGSPDAAGYQTQSVRPVAPINPVTFDPLAPEDFGPKRLPTYQPVTPQEDDMAFEAAMSKYYEDLKSIESKQKSLAGSQYANFGTMADSLSKEKQDLLTKTPEQVHSESTRTLRAERAADYLYLDPTDEAMWTDYMSNTLTEGEFAQYQKDPLFQKLAQSKASQEIQTTGTLKDTRAALEDKYGGELTGPEEFWEALVSWAVHDVPGTIETIAGSSFGEGMRKTMSLQSTTDPFVTAGESAFLGTTAEDKRDEVTEIIEAIEVGAEADLLQGAEYFQEAGLHRAAITQGNFAKEFMYDATKVLPDMVVMAGLGAMSGGVFPASQGVGMSAKQVFSTITKKETQKALLKAIGSKMIMGPETLPMGMRIFAQSYQGNLEAGMGEDQAYFTAILNAYGQSVLEGLGVNELVKTQGAKPAIKVLTSFFEEGFEEIPQNWWESAVQMTAGGQSMPIFEMKDKDAEALFNAPRDLYSFFVALPGGAMGATPSAIATGAEAFNTMTTPGVTLPGVGGVAAQREVYENQQAEKAEINLEDVPEEYASQTYEATERTEAAKQVMSQVLDIESNLTVETMESENEADFAAAMDRNLDMSEDMIMEDVLNDNLSEASMDLINRQAYKNRLDLPTPQTAMSEAMTDAGMETTVEAPVYESEIDVTKMHPKVLQRMNNIVAKAPVESILTLAEDGKSMKQIASELGVPKSQVKSTLTMKGVPKAGTKAFNHWVTGRMTADGRISQARVNLEKQVAVVEAAKQVIINKPDPITTTEATAQLNKTGLAQAGVKVKANLTHGHKAMVQFAKQLGVDLVYYEGGDKDVRGVYNYSSENANTVFINSDRAKGSEHMDILGHEFFHAVAKNSPEVYEDLKKYIGDTITSDQMETVLDKFNFDEDYRSQLDSDRDALIEEIMADEAGRLFTDQTFWTDLYAKEPSIAKKLGAAIRNFLDMVLDKINNGGIQVGVLTQKQIQDFRDSFTDITSGVIKANSLDIAETVNITEGTAQPRYSVRSFAQQDKAETIQGLMDAGFTEVEATKYVNDMTSIAALVLDNPALQYDPNDEFSPVKPNSDPLYTWSIDFSTLCKKRAKMQATLDAIYSANGSYLNKADIMKVRTMLSDLGDEVACGLCYVDAARLKETNATNELLEDWVGGISRKIGMAKPEYKQAQKDFLNGRKKNQLNKKDLAKYEAIKDTAAEYVTAEEIAEIEAVDPKLLLTTEGKSQMARDHKEVYDLATAYIREKSHAKSYQPRSEYVPGMIQQTITQGQMDNMNRNGGLRWQSWSDFEFVHMLDAMQTIGDMSMVGLKGHMYTKVPEAVDALGNTGMMINLSLIAKGDTGFDADGNLEFDPVEGMPFDTAMALRGKYSNTAGTIAIGVNDDHIRAMMADDRIDYIIPYHISGLAKAQRVEAGIGEWQDYTKLQEEKMDGKNTNNTPEFHDWWDYSNSGDQNTINYLNNIRDRGVQPKFKDFLLNGQGIKAFNQGTVLTEKHVNPGAWKLLTDRKMFNNEGEVIVQMPVKPKFDAALISRMMKSYTNTPVTPNTEVVEAFSAPATKYSKRVQENFGVSPEMAEIAGEALAEIEVLSKGISSEFIDKGGIFLKGKTINSSEDLAAIAQIARDPRFELLSYIFTDAKGEIIKQEVISSRMPGSAMGFPSMYNSIGEYLNEIVNGAKDIGAKAMYLMHNHPSGNPRASRADEALTRFVAEPLTRPGSSIKFGGHVIINSGKYGYLNSDGMGSIFDLDVAGVDKLLTPSVDGPSLGMEIRGPADVAKALKASNLVPNKVTLVARSGVKVRGVIQVDSSIMQNSDNLTKFIRETAVEFGSNSMFLAHDGEYANDIDDGLFDWLVEDGIVADISYKNAYDNTHGLSRVNEGAELDPNIDIDVEYGAKLIGTRITPSNRFSIRPTSDKWQLSQTFDQVKSAHPELFGTPDQVDSAEKHGTQIATTVSTYKRIGQALLEQGFEGRVLDYGAGMGRGSEALKEMGIDIVDFEPFPGPRTPDYTDFESIPGDFDVVINNAVLNVLPQDLRDQAVTNMYSALKPGGRMILNVRGSDVLSAKTKVEINADNWEFYIPSKKSYQKGFRRPELISYLQDVLPNADVVTAGKMVNGTAAIVTKPETITTSDVIDKYSARAYHGSGVDFNKFDLDYLDTGEGAQAYGWGLYFAEDEGIAKWYRDKMARKVSGRYSMTNKAGSDLMEVMEGLGPYQARFFNDIAETAHMWYGEMSVSELNGLIQMELNQVKNDGVKEALQSMIDAINENTSGPNEMLDTIERPGKGKMYEVEVPDKSALIDYNESMFGGQPPVVQEAFNKLVDKYRDVDDEFFNETNRLYQNMRDKYGDYEPHTRATPEEYQEYLDAELQFDLANMVFSLLKRQERGKDVTGEMFFKLLEVRLKSDYEASMFVKNEMGIKGLMFWDANSRSRNAKTDGTGTRNFVVWDDSEVHIMRKYSKRAYHGTPHDFNKFSFDEIGSGEGAQAYGYGLYFAESKGVAESYRDNLSKPRTDFAMFKDGVEMSFNNWAAAHSQGAREIGFQLEWEDGVTPIGTLEEALELAEDFVDDFAMGALEHEDPILMEQLSDMRDALEEMATFDEDFYSVWANEDNIDGRLFEVNLDIEESNTIQYANFQKDQPLIVTQAVESIAAEYGINITPPEGLTWSGHSLYRALVKGLKSDVVASKLLSERGVKGIMYPNWSEEANNYVVFNDADIEILNKWNKRPEISVQMDPKEKEKGESFLKNLYRRVVDRFAPIGEESRKAKVLSANAAIVSGTVEHISTEALVDTVGNVVDKSLKEAVGPIAEDQEFWEYMAQLHNIDRAREGKPVDPSMTPDDSSLFVAEQEQIHPEWRKSAQDVTAWIDSFMMEWAVKPGIIDAEVYQEWREMYPNYFPTQREFSDLEGGGSFGPGKRFVDLPSPVKKAKGSSRDISNPVGNIIQMVNKVVRTERYNEVGQALMESARQGSEMLTEIPAAEAMFMDNLDNVVQIWEDGRPAYIEVHNQELLDSIKGLPRIINNAKAMRKITGVYKGLITQDNPLFAIRNIMRDVPTAYIYGSQHNPIMFGLNLVKAGVQAATGTGGAARYKALGGGGSGQFHADEAAEYARLLQPSAASKLGAPIRGIRKLNEIMELAPRISEFNHVMKKTGDVHEALYAAQNVTVDFARGGDITKMAEPFVPYLNASVQGIDRFFQAFDFKNDPVGALTRMAKAGIAITAPQLASYMMSMLEQPEEYEELSQRTKDSYYIFPKGDGTFHKIPKSREVSVVFGSLLERALAGNFDGFLGTVATNFSPVDPFTNNLFSPLMYNIPMNEDFAGRPIVPANLEDYSPRNQYDTNTSEIAKYVGDKANLSPEQIDYLIRSYSGVIGQFLVPATTQRSGAGTALERMTTGAFTADPAFSSETVTKFYDMKEEALKAKNDKNRDQGVPSEVVTDEERFYNELASISSSSSKATKYINTLQADDPQIREIKLLVQKYMRQALDAKTVTDLMEIDYILGGELYLLGIQ